MGGTLFLGKILCRHSFVFLLLEDNSWLHDRAEVWGRAVSMDLSRLLGSLLERTAGSEQRPSSIAL